METKMTMQSLAQFAYDPTKNAVIFDGHRVNGFAHPLKYRRVDEDTHELHLQIMSEFLQKVGVGNTGVLTIGAHAGGERKVSINCGVLRVDTIYIKELTAEVPEVVVVLKKV
ncbi:virion structural protein [Cronobacter phage CR9]|uniref:Uncharacterized protein n=1 Tax=Cronobacter phage CR9 TaxID=1162290 RepID=M1F2F1_9CAUD|nr:virion structural protein [Cronobacter phage CR9]AFH21144.1 hypothetical protein CR9_260 [Cronobacter phage CR9]